MSKKSSKSNSNNKVKKRKHKDETSDSDEERLIDQSDIESDLSSDENIKIKNKKQTKSKKKTSKNKISSDSYSESESDSDELDITTKKNNKKDAKGNSKILEIKTTQTGAFKQVIERIANVISDCCIIFVQPDANDDDSSADEYYEEIEEGRHGSKNKKTKNKKSKKRNPGGKNNKKNQTKRNTGGIRILRLTEDRTILIKLNLDAQYFEYFRCDEPKITIGVDMHALHALLKMINDDDPIMLYMNRDNRSILYIRSLNENNDNSEETDIEVFLMEIGNSDIPLPRPEFEGRITIASDKFHTICKHLNNNSTSVEITSYNNEISFKGQNEGGRVKMSYKDITKEKCKSGRIVQGVYELRNLMGFSKCNKLCSTVDLYLKNDFPLVLVISVASLGKMYVFLSPIDNDKDDL